MEIYSTHNEEESVVAERFVKILKHEIYKYMILVPANVYIDELDDIVNKYNNICHSTIKMMPADVKSSKYIEFSITIMIKILNLRPVIMQEY